MTKTTQSERGSLRRRDVLALGGASLALGLSRNALAQPERVDVAILGAGLSGMYAGMLLKELGASVTILESADRAGGRCLTAKDWRFTPDLGASQIGGTYGRVRDVCRRLNVELAPGSHVNAPYTPVVGDQLVPAETWAQSKLNRTVGAEREILPHAMFGYYVGQRTPFEGLNDWRSPAAAEYDVSIEQWLQQQGASPDAMRIMRESAGHSPLNQRSILRMLQETTRGAIEMKQFSKDQRRNLDQYQIASRISSHVVGGTSVLTDAMAAELGETVRLNSAVSAVEQNQSGCVVTLADGGRVNADFVLAAMPFSSLRKVALTPALTGAQAQAVNDMPYNNQSQIWFEVTSPYWEQDELNASMWTDGPLQYIRQQIKPDGSRVLMSAIASARKAAHLDSMTPEDRGEFARREIERIRPSTVGRLKVIGVHSWSEGPHVGGCSFEFPVGRVLDWTAAMAQPHGRVHFSGEHLRQAELGMEAAMETGERAAIEIAGRVLA